MILYNIPLRFLCFISLFFCFNRIDSIIYLSFIFRNFCFADLADSSGRHLPTYKKSLGWQNFPSLWLVRSGLSCSSRFFLRVQGWDINYCRQTLQHNFRNWKDNKIDFCDINHCSLGLYHVFCDVDYGKLEHYYFCKPCKNTAVQQSNRSQKFIFSDSS